MAEAKWRIKPFRFFVACSPHAAHQRSITPALPAGTGPAPLFERHPFRAGIVGEGTNIDNP